MKFPKVHQVYPVNWKFIYSLLEHTLVHTHTHKHQTSRWESLTLHAGHHSAMVAVGGMPVWQAARGLSLPGNGHRYPYRGLSHLSLPLSFPWVLAYPLRALILPRWRGSPGGRVCFASCRAQLEPLPLLSFLSFLSLLSPVTAPCLRQPRPPNGLFWENSSGCWLLYFIRLLMALLSGPWGPSVASCGEVRGGRGPWSPCEVWEAAPREL